MKYPDMATPRGPQPLSGKLLQEANGHKLRQVVAAPSAFERTARLGPPVDFVHVDRGGIASVILRFDHCSITEPKDLVQAPFLTLWFYRRFFRRQE